MVKSLPTSDLLRPVLCFLHSISKNLTWAVYHQSPWHVLMFFLGNIIDGKQNLYRLRPLGYCSTQSYGPVQWDWTRALTLRPHWLQQGCSLQNVIYYWLLVYLYTLSKILKLKFRFFFLFFFSFLISYSNEMEIFIDLFSVLLLLSLRENRNFLFLRLSDSQCLKYSTF